MSVGRPCLLPSCPNFTTISPILALEPQEYCRACTHSFLCGGETMQMMLLCSLSRLHVLARHVVVPMLLLWRSCLMDVGHLNRRITSRATGGGVFGRLRGHPHAHWPVYVVGLEKSRVYPGLNVTFVIHPDPRLHTNMCAASDATSRYIYVHPLK